MTYTQKTLGNGMRIITAPMQNTKAITIIVLVGTGSNYEPQRINGISHFLEHMFFKGTKHRPRAGDVHRALDRLGAEHNAFTSKEITGFWVKSADRYFDESLDIISDILLEPLFKKEELEKEKGVIIQEISMYEDLPQRKVLEVWDVLLYSNQPAGRSIAGTKEIINSITRKDIVDYKKKHYVASNMVVAVAGNIDEGSVFAKIEKVFKKIAQGKNGSKSPTREEQKFPLVKILDKNTDQTHLVLGVRSFDMFDERKYALGILGVLLGGNSSSKLFSEIREKLGLAYYINAASEYFLDAGYLLARAGIPHNSLKTVAKKIVKVMRDFREKKISPNDLKFAKDYLAGSMALVLESSDEIAMFYGEQELFYKKILKLEDIWKKYESVTEKDILNVSRFLFRPDKIGLAVIAPKNGAEEQAFQKILSEI